MLSTIKREPYRIFFPLGILIGIYGVSHWLFFALGWIPSYSSFFHASIQIQGYMACFIIGFLLTAIPRFASAPHASFTELLSFLILTIGGVIFHSMNQIVFAEGIFLVWLFAVLGFVVRRFRKKKVNHPPVEFVWIPIGIFHAMVGAFLVIVSQLKFVPAWLMEVGKPLILQGFVLSIVLGVGGFLAPRLMGRSEIIQRYDHDAAQGKQRIKRTLLYLVTGILLFSSFWIEGLGYKVQAYGLRATVVLFCFVRNHIFPHPPKVSDGYVRLLAVSIWMIALGYLLLPFFSKYRTALLHLVFLGGYSLMTFAVATMVIVSHSGFAPRLKRRLWALDVVAMGIAVSLILRIGAVFNPSHYFTMLGISSIFWSITAITWLGCMIPYLGQVPAPDAFERNHEEMKRRIQNC